VPKGKGKFSQGKITFHYREYISSLIHRKRKITFHHREYVSSLIYRKASLNLKRALWGDKPEGLLPEKLSQFSGRPGKLPHSVPKGPLGLVQGKVFSGKNYFSLQGVYFIFDQKLLSSQLVYFIFDPPQRKNYLSSQGVCFIIDPPQGLPKFKKGPLG
jgi:hypothetical protein